MNKNYEAIFNACVSFARLVHLVKIWTAKKVVISLLGGKVAHVPSKYAFTPGSEDILTDAQGFTKTSMSH